MSMIIINNMLRELKASEVENFTIGNRSDLYKAAWDQGYQVGVESAQPKWISGEERLPEELEDVLVSTGKKHVFCAYRSYSGRWFTGDIELEEIEVGDTVTHWMPLPEPPKEEA